MTWESSAITITTLLPIAGALVILLVPKDRDRMVRGLGILFTGAALVLSIAIAIGFDYGTRRAAVRARRRMDRRDRRAVPRGHRRHLDGAVRAHVPAVVPVRHLHLAVRAGARPHEGVPRPDAPARDRDGRDVHRVRPDPVLRVLGDGPRPDVLPDRDLGLREPRVRGDQVLPLHALRLRLHAAGVPRALLHRTGTAHVRPREAHRVRGKRRLLPHVPADRVRGDRARVRDQGSDVAVPHVAARRPYGGSDDRLGAAGRDHAEDGDVRVHPDRAAGAARRARRPTRRGSGSWRRSRSCTRRSRASRSGI